MSDSATIREPRIMLIDLPESVAQRLRDLGYNVSVGTFGRPFRAKPGEFVCSNHSLSLLHEQGIIFIDLEEPSFDENTTAPALPTTLSPTDQLCVVPERQRYFNPRPYAALFSSSQFEEIVSQGGIIVAFAGRRRDETYEFYTWARVPAGGGIATNYDWWPQMGQHVANRTGTEVRFDGGDLFDHLAQTAGQDAFYTAAFLNLDKNHDYPLAHNHLGEVVSFVRVAAKGLLIFLPRFDDFGPVVEMMLRETLVDLSPALFPHSTRHTWLSKPEYQWPAVLDLQARHDELEEEYKARIADVEQQMATEKERLSFLHGILKGTGSQLVDDLAQTLRFLGFHDVRVVDADRRAREEDIQIWDRERPFLIEVKGISGCPTEADCQQVLKYIMRRRREYGRADIGGVFAVNHQRHVPGLERDPAFTQPQIDDAKHNGYALTTTWDLFRAIIATMKGLLEFTDVQTALVSQIGQVDYIPRNWRELGTVKHYYPQPMAALVALYDSETLRVGDMVAFLSDERRYDQRVESLQIDGQPVEEVDSGVEFGILVEQPVDKSFRFFKVELQAQVE